MAFNPLRFESTLKNDADPICDYHDCSYILPNQFNQFLPPSKTDVFTVLNANIRSVSKKFR